MKKILLYHWVLTALLLAATASCYGDQRLEAGFTPLISSKNLVSDWTVRAWHEVSEPSEARWKLADGVLHGGEPRGSWLLSKQEYDDFELRFEFKLGEQGNSGLALRAPLEGDPAFDGIELQMADLRYNPEALDSELTGGLYRAVAPRKQVYKPTEWNQYRVRLKGERLKAWLNGELIHDLDLAKQAQPVKRHDGRPAPPLKDRPRRGHIGFQELSRGGAHVLIRDARIRTFD
ncbi:MAG TPA: DUF1080 domain-containing protein [Lacipirellula sp.]